MIVAFEASATIFAIATEVLNPVNPPGPILTATSSISLGVMQSDVAPFSIEGKTSSSSLFPPIGWDVIVSPSLFINAMLPYRPESSNDRVIGLEDITIRSRPLKRRKVAPLIALCALHSEYCQAEQAKQHHCCDRCLSRVRLALKYQFQLEPRRVLNKIV